MRNTRLVVLVVAALASTASLAGAQSTVPDSARAASRMAKGMRARAGLLRGVTLTDAEKSKLKELRKRRKDDFRAALTPEHQKQFDANMEQAAQRRAGAKKGRRGGADGRPRKVRPTPNG